jgi:sigma-B regulation protein RsbU (phosphoserine phosphatase)
METDMVKYLDDIVAITAEREKSASELLIAARIQNDALPDTFPPFPDRKEIDIYASMDPAKEVGGDFYNFFFIDPDHLALVIADVSGKGVPGALFMMESNLVIAGRMWEVDKPSVILSEVNDYLSKSNHAQMFVTVWLGILEISSGHLYYANAGHEYPAICHDGKFELLKDKHGLVLGGMESVRYTDYEIQLDKGDKIFIYTDGVPEATDKDNNLFGTDRMVDALNKNPKARPEEMLKNVRTAVDRFVGIAEQFDDLTMLCLEYRG